jgi:biotin carboxyl carrier protein
VERARSPDGAVRYTARVRDRALHIDLDPRGPVLVNGERVEADAVGAGAGVYSVLLGPESHEVVLLQRAPDLRVVVDGRELPLTLADERAAETAGSAGAAATSEVQLRAPMPGLIVAVHVREGDVVDEGASVCTLEAMKMENEIFSPRRARVVELRAAAGGKVNGGDLLATLAPQ